MYSAVSVWSSEALDEKLPPEFHSYISDSNIWGVLDAIAFEKWHISNSFKLGLFLWFGVLVLGLSYFSNFAY